MNKIGKNKKGHKKGQFFSYDAIVAAILFGIVLSLIFVYWISMRNFMGSEATEMFSLALSISDSLMKPGVPADWHVYYNGDIKNIPKIQSVGLTDGYSNKINLAKFSNFSNLTAYDEGYQKLRENYGTYNYEFYVLLEYGGKTSEAGLKYSDPKSKISFKKPVVVGGTPGNLTVTIWRK
jgi:hypothetical protein